MKQLKYLIIGPIGAGKSTFSLKLASMVKMEKHHVDMLVFHDAYQMKSEKEQIEVLQKMKDRDRFICEGLRIWQLEYIIDDNSRIIILDYPIFCCMFRFLKRHLFQRKDSPMNFMLRLFDVRVVKWIIRSKTEISRFIREKSDDCDMVVLKNRKEEESFLVKMRREYT